MAQASSEAAFLPEVAATGLVWKSLIQDTDQSTGSLSLAQYSPRFFATEYDLLSAVCTSAAALQSSAAQVQQEAYPYIICQWDVWLRGRGFKGGSAKQANATATTKSTACSGFGVSEHWGRLELPQVLHPPWGYAKVGLSCLWVCFWTWWPTPSQTSSNQSVQSEQKWGAKRTNWELCWQFGQQQCWGQSTSKSKSQLAKSNKSESKWGVFSLLPRII